ncbi:MAG: hypothetical protein MO846_10690 [Candidatus Devosia symbiotica]|nr:hypothetical protein [Candidatus Devosia symbiotica]
MLNRFGSAEAALDALPDLTRRSGRPVSVTSQAQAEDEIAGLSRYSARLVAQSDSDYPPLLEFIATGPAFARHG